MLATERNSEAIGYKSAKYRLESAIIQISNLKILENFRFFAKGTFLALKSSVLGFGRDTKFWQQMRSYVRQSANYRPYFLSQKTKIFKIFQI